MKLKLNIPTGPIPWSGPQFKRGATALKITKHETRTKAETAEQRAKAAVRRRDRGCRFPLCGCRRLKLQLIAAPEVSHEQHKGMGGNPAGDRSTAAGMVQLCKHRHQDGAVSRHKGTLRARFLTKQRYAGPVAWLIDKNAAFGRFSKAPRWWEVAREIRPGVLAPLEDVQRTALELLAKMEL